MKNEAIAADTLLATEGTTAQATTWNIDNSHSNVKFSVSHLVISDVEGAFKSFNGTIQTSKSDFSDAQIDFAIDINSINTDNEGRDTHLKSDDFFNAEKFPQMIFKGTSFTKLS